MFEYMTKIYLIEKVFKSLKRCLLMSVFANYVFDRQTVLNKRPFQRFFT